MDWSGWICSVVLLIVLLVMLFRRRKVEQKSTAEWEQKKTQLEHEIELREQERRMIEQDNERSQKNMAEALARELAGASQRVSSFYEEKTALVNLELQQYTDKIAQEKEKLSQDLATFCQNLAQERERQQQAFSAAVQQLDLALSDKKSVYQSIMKALTEAEERENDTFHRITIPRKEQEDIIVLEEKVLPLLNSPEPIRRLIWTLYIQKPATEMIDRILPAKEISGIYKITNIRNKRCYIGRSVNVRNRLLEHIKSSLGVGTIASQHVHDVMREEGLWNFSFELLEAADKDILAAKEKYYIGFFEADGKNGYNLTKGGG